MKKVGQQSGRNTIDKKKGNVRPVVKRKSKSINTKQREKIEILKKSGLS